MEYRELFLALFRKFDERYHPRSFLCDLVETTHLFLKMLERFCRSRGNLMVQVQGRPRLWEQLSVIPIAAVSGTPRIHKKKRFLIEDEDEDY